MFKLLLLASVFATAAHASPLFACVCGELPDDRTPAEKMMSKVKAADAVFTGKVIAIVYRKGGYDEGFEKYRIDIKKPWLEYENKFVRFKVDRWWAGNVPVEIELITDEKRFSDNTGTGTSCGYSFEEGKSYAVFAYKRGSNLTTSNCSPTSELKDKKALTDLIGEGKPPLKREDN